MTHADTTNPDFPEFSWNEKEISYILSSFYWGFVLTQVLGSVCCRRWGAKLSMAVSMIASTVIFSATPWLVLRGGWQAFCVLRLVMGLFQGILFPCIFQHMAQWTPAHELNRLCGLTLSGVEFGEFSAPFIAGFIAAGPLGWPGIFYILAGICLLWVIFWIIFAANNPTESKMISDAEKRYIESSKEHDSRFYTRNIPVPWKAIFTSIPYNALLITRCAALWSLSTVLYQLPTFLNAVYRMDIKTNAIFSTLPFVISWITGFVFILLADIIMHNNWMTLGNLLRTFNTIGCWTPVVGLVAIGYLAEEYAIVALVLLTIGIGVTSGGEIGSALNLIDLSPNHSGILTVISLTLANLMALFSPLFVGVIVTDTSSREQWQIVFGVAAAVYFIGNLIYRTLGAFEPQPWDAAGYLQPKDP